uniref:Uncharacterized protein n=1 Tax=viral metagenome TaxID=1070528 RepID=A0A6C0J3A7_9ZZZZ
MSNTYKLVNPYIKGEMKTSIKTKNSINAAKTFYKNLSEHFNNNIPKFYFTIQKGGSGKGKLYHFEVSEKKTNSEVSYSIKPYEVKGELSDKFVDTLKSFKSRYNKKGSGKSRKTSNKGKKRGKKSEKKDSPSDVNYWDYDYVPAVSQPLYYFYYDPQVYKLDSFFIPTFYAYATPFIEINGLGYSYVL